MGTGWTGKKTINVQRKSTIFVEPGDVVIRCARPLHAGLCKGSSDLIGIQPVTITPDMVGMTLGVFTGLEVKTERGVQTPPQQNFENIVTGLGGIAGVVRSEGDCYRVLKRYER